MSALRELTQRAIAASTVLSSACSAGKAISDSQYAHIDRAAIEARQQLRDHLAREYGIDARMADQLGAIL
jgi:hypothetical protein